MATRRRKNQVPLIIEPHPDNYTGYPFITLIQYRQTHVLSIIDNADDKRINAFVLDYCGPEMVNEEQIISVAEVWYDESSGRYPIAFEFSKRELSEETSKIFRSFNIDYVSRIIGPLPSFPMNETGKVKRRRRKAIPKGVEIKRKILQLR